MSGYQAAALEFLSTPSARRATSPGDSFFARPRNFYPRPPRGGRRASSMVWRRSSSFLSTPSARRATPSRRTPDRTRSISIHALREEGDHYVVYIVSRTKRFLSTPSARRATRWPHSSDPDPLHFYPRPPRGGRLSNAVGRRTMTVFLSTPSARRATANRVAAADHDQHFYPRPPRGGRRSLRLRCMWRP